jgi:hypothetical protein
VLTDDRSLTGSTGLVSVAAGRRALAAGVVVVGLLAAACSGTEPGASDDIADGRSGANPGPLPTLSGGVELQQVDPATLLVGADLAFGSPLPSDQAAADAFANDPEVRGVLLRRAYEAPTARRLADVLVLTLDGAQLFDEGVLSAFQDTVVETLAGGDVTSLELVGRRTLHATGSVANVVAFREGNALVIVSSAQDADAVLVVTRQLEARARGELGTGEPRTPLVATPAEAAFLPVPTIAFTPFSPPEDEPPPAPPALPGAAGVQGRYGVVAGERRTTVWAIAVDVGAYPTAEALDPAMRELVAARAAGVAPEAVEVLGRAVLVAGGPVGEPSAQAFRHQGLVVLVEGVDPAQVDAVTTAWIAALGPT